MTQAFCDALTYTNFMFGTLIGFCDILVKVKCQGNGVQVKVAIVKKNKKTHVHSLLVKTIVYSILLVFIYSSTHIPIYTNV